MMMNSQHENSSLHTMRQVQKARQARNIHQMMGCPSLNNCKNAIEFHHIENCPVTWEDIKIVEDIFGLDINALKGKMVQKASPVIELDCIEVTKKFKIESEWITIFVDGIQ